MRVLNPGLGSDDAPKEISKGCVLSYLKGFLQVAETNTAKPRMACGGIHPSVHVALPACREDWLRRMQGSEHHFGTQVLHRSAEMGISIFAQATMWHSPLVSERFSNNPSVFPAPLPCTEVFPSLFCKRGIGAGQFREKTAARFARPVGAV